MDVTAFKAGVTADIVAKTGTANSIPPNTVGAKLNGLADIAAAAVTPVEAMSAQNKSDIDAIKIKTYTTKTGVPGSAPGFYRADTGVWQALAGYLSNLYDISTIPATSSILATGSTNGILSALAVYFTSANVFISAQLIGTAGSVLTYTRQALTIPANTKYVALVNNSATVYPVLEALSLTIPDTTTMQSDVTTLKTNVASLQTDMSSLKTNVYAALAGANQTPAGFYAYNTGVYTAFANYLSTLFDISASPGATFAATGLVQGTGVALAVYFTSAMVYIGYQIRGTTVATQYTRQALTIPANTKYVALVNNSATVYPVLETVTTQLPDISGLSNRVTTIEGRNQWKSKKIVWLGTSVSFGANATKSYAQEAANKLGFTLVNASVPGLAIHANDDGSGGLNPLTYGSSVLSKAEYTAKGITIASSPITPYVPGGSYNNYYWTWENVFTAGNADADLWVFDVAPNNTNFALTDWNAFNKNTWAYNDDSAFSTHRTTFLGALLFLIDKMYALNPNARMLLLSGSSFNYTQGVTAFQTIVTQWQIAYKDIWSKINVSPKSNNVIKSLGGTDQHPSTFAHTILGKILTNELLLIA